MKLRAYERERDLEAVQRIWSEVGWVSGDEQVAAVEDFFSAGEALVADVGDSAEAAVNGARGKMKYQQEDLDLWCVTSVTVGRIARRRGLAQSMTAELLAIGAQRGHEIAALGMFEQGFYDRLGFGTGGYEHWVTFDPAKLQIDRPYPPPRRLTLDDWKIMHRAMVQRRRRHGGVLLDDPAIFKAECVWAENAFGLGIVDDRGDLSHFFWATAKGESGPYVIKMLCYDDGEQLLDLLTLMQSLGDQVSTIGMLEPNDIQFQDLLRHPIRNRRNTAGADEHEKVSKAMAVWQARILDLEGCLAKTHLPGPTVEFNLRLSDPIAELLPPEGSWRGIGGDWQLALGRDSHATRGTDPALPTLEASVGAFTRFWLGCQNASGLRATDHFRAPDSLVEQLDWTVRLPRIQLGWDF